jgi:hypothetical protein
MRLCLALLVFVGISLSLKSQIVFNEIVSKNEGGLLNDFQNYSDWIEFYNSSTTDILLKDYYLSDDLSDTYKWQMPNRYLKGQSHIVIFASDEHGDLHANFKISSQGEALYLSHIDSGLVDSFPPVPLLENQAFGRFPDGTAQMGILNTPSPNTTNNTIAQDFSILYFSHHNAFQQKPFELEILASNPEATLHFTSNSEIPTANSPQYNNPLPLRDLKSKPNSVSEVQTADNWYPPKETIYKGHTIRVAAFLEGEQISKVYTKTYFVDENIAERYSFPIVSLVTQDANLFDNESGIYVKGQNTNYSQRGRQWERPVHFEYFDRNGKLLVQQELGLRTNGNKGRTLAQKSLLLYARNSYGKKRLNHPFFEDKEKDSFKRIILRSASSNDWKNTLFKNELAQKIVKELNLEHPASQEVIVFVNGSYWGIHHLNERMDEYFIEDYLGVQNIDLLSADAKVEEGSNADFLTLRNYLQTNDLSQEVHYSQVSNWIDIDNLIDYYCTQLFLANTDWPHNNIKFWKAQKDGKWRWLFFDCDECMSYENYELLGDFISARGVRQDFPEWSTELMHHLFKNENFKQSFRYRFNELLESTFSTQNLMKHIDETKALYAPEVNEHCMRWSAPNDINDWQEAVKGLYSFAAIRPTIMKEQLNDYFGLPFSLYPNPTNGLLNIDLLVQDNHFERLSIENSLGKELMSFSQKWTNPITLHHLKSGVYFIEIQLQGHSYTERLLVF